MTCEELYERLTELAEGTLRADAGADVQQHLAECAECRAVRQDLEDLARLCREVQATATTMPDDVRQRIETLLASGDDSGRRRPLA
jgi:predicted anti-sigma-YlaC factor YlaD